MRFGLVNGNLVQDVIWPKSTLQGKSFGSQLGLGLIHNKLTS